VQRASLCEATLLQLEQHQGLLPPFNLLSKCDDDVKTAAAAATVKKRRASMQSNSCHHPKSIISQTLLTQSLPTHAISLAMFDCCQASGQRSWSTAAQPATQTAMTVPQAMTMSMEQMGYAVGGGAGSASLYKDGIISRAEFAQATPASSCSRSTCTRAVPLSPEPEMMS